MTLVFDHLVHFTNSPEEALLKFKEIGLHAKLGGRHEHLGTYNVLSYFGLSYIEFIGIFDRNLVDKSIGVKHSLPDSFVKNNFAEGPLRIALRSSDIQADAKRFRELGLEVTGPVNLTRTQPDGKTLSWSLLFVGTADQTVELPFLIQWDDSDEERIEELTTKGFLDQHSSGDVVIDSVGYAVKNVEEAAKWWEELFQFKIDSTFTDDKLNAKAISLFVPGGNIHFYEPLGEGIVKDILDRRGEGLFTLQFKGSSASDLTLFNVLYRF